LGTCHLAVDIGASSGRVMVGWLEQTKDDRKEMKLEEIYRFTNGMLMKDSHYVWDIDHLYQSIIQGIKEAVKKGLNVVSLAIDTWAVDFVLLDEKGSKLTEAVAYRDSRTDGVMEEIFETVDKDTIYKRTGIQFQPFNTLYQLAALQKSNPEMLKQAQTFLMIPDYLNYLLTGVAVNEYTNASTTQFINIETNDWDKALLEQLSIPTHFLKEIKMPGTTIGQLTEEVSDEVGCQLQVILPATHDTGSAVAALPENEETLFLSSGTWSLLGIEAEEPIATKEALRYNFTNEGGVDYRFRFLKNIMGLWMIQEVKRLMDDRISFAEFVTLGREASGFSSKIDVNDNRFLNPANMIEEIESYCRETKQVIPSSPGELARLIFVSLAESYKETIEEIESITGKSFNQINIIGGGCQNELLNELLVEESGLKVVAGPVEATAIGNVVMQMIEAEELANLKEAREIIKHSFQIKEYEPKGEEK